MAGVTARSGNAPLTFDGQDAALWREAEGEGEGRVVRNVDIDLIETGWIARDRTVLDPGEMAELVASVRARGVRMPVEVVPVEGGRFGLISGRRRILAAAEAGLRAVPALVRERPADLATSYEGMVEENEVRVQLTAYERGRIAVIAAGLGAYPDVHGAVAGLFGAASHAKRSKVKAFAAIHEELGDLLRFGPAITERQGLAVAAALKAGQGPAIRAALEGADAATAAEEAAALDEGVRGAPKRERAGSARGESLAPGLRVVRTRTEMRIVHEGIGAQGERELLELVRYWAERRAERRGESPEQRPENPGWAGDGKD
ncbi:ParB family chromosome partitioning protein [Hasllibacter halocynthiae]|uniref:ParB family chromosome partitioning protein n=1 Tax=Hasllibacter halocynthiae TaxID=595589 RepID=A0A2T0WZJ2_9RHOB|nr:ParB/RepB/Spo0J family partition protein [Hasllibacter halocynthiae]PRY92087.1 ParB family chromosome partitioning protein [Hasllibacter halocynthiae]